MISGGVPLGRKKSRPRRGAKRRKARLREGRDIGQRRVAFVGAARRQRLELAGIDLRFERSGREQSDVYFARSHRREDRRGAVEGDVRQVGSGHALEPFHDQVRIGTETERGVVEPVRVRLGIFHQVGHARDPQRWDHRQHLLLQGDHRDRIEVVVWVVAQLGIEQRIEGDRVLRQQADGAAVGRRALTGIGGDTHVATRTVLHDHRLLGPLFEGVAHGARENVESRAGRKRHDDAKGLPRVFFGGNRCNVRRD